MCYDIRMCSHQRGTLKSLWQVTRGWPQQIVFVNIHLWVWLYITYRSQSHIFMLVIDIAIYYYFMVFKMNHKF